MATADLMVSKARLSNDEHTHWSASAACCQAISYEQTAGSRLYDGQSLYSALLIAVCRHLDWRNNDCLPLCIRDDLVQTSVGMSH